MIPRNGECYLSIASFRSPFFSSAFLTELVIVLPYSMYENARLEDCITILSLSFLNSAHDVFPAGQQQLVRTLARTRNNAVQSCPLGPLHIALSAQLDFFSPLK
jgi:hypothetical protein